MKGQRARDGATGAGWPRWAGAAILGALVLSFGHAASQGQEKKPPEGTAAQKRTSVNNLKQLTLALISYADANRGWMPAAAYLDPKVKAGLGNPVLTAELLAKTKGKIRDKTLPLLSWRVAILPYIEQNALYKEFKLDEPWDSAHNKKLLEKMPKIFAPVTGKTKEPGLTYYQVFTGKDTPFDGTVPPRFPASFPDGASNTFLVVEAGEAVPWTKPQDVPYDAGKALPKLGGLFAGGFHVAMADGSVRYVARGAEEKAIRAAITPRGAEVSEPPGKEVK
jgi:hypothetical protein